MFAKNFAEIKSIVGEASAEINTRYLENAKSSFNFLTIIIRKL